MFGNRDDPSVSSLPAPRTPATPNASRPTLAPDSARDFADQEENESGTGRPPRTALTAATLHGHDLPPPVLQSALSKKRKGSKKSARIDGGVRVHWARFRKRMGTGTAPSESTMPDESVVTGSSLRGFSRRPSTAGGPGVRIASGDGYAYDDTDGEGGAEHKEVDEVVVDRAWADEIKSSVLTHSEREELAEKGGSLALGGGTSTDRDSVAYHVGGFWGSFTLLLILRWRLWPAILDFFSLRFFDPSAERHYGKEYWFMRKTLTLWSSCFLVLNWVLTVAFLPRPLPLGDKIFYYGVTPAATFPLIFMIMWDFPRDRAIVYQIWVCFAIWIWPFYESLDIFLCGFYDPAAAVISCGGKDFVGAFYFVCALPTVGLFALQMKRFPFLIASLVFFALASALQLPVKPTFYRNLINSFVFHLFLLYIHYMRENAERRLYTLRDQLKIQFRATQKAQVNERKAADSKRRLTSYVFHEVRVPLNTALLATQNMAATGIVVKSQEIEFKALEGSLSMMSKVLNDVLDFNRMDSGRFESVSRPYPFHHVMRSLFVPLRLATDARKLEFVTDLDPSIDVVARRAAYQAIGENAKGIKRRMGEDKDAPGIVVGDEMRLRQIINNLASNACKFTPSGGKLTITTKLIWPTSADTPTYQDQIGAVARPSPDVGTENNHHILTDKHLRQHEEDWAKLAPPLEKIIVRIEVTDTGCGIPSKDMVHNKLFSAFNQTEVGRTQGGKGTGLGLALVRQIVKRSGGRLGVRSKLGSGSTFWVELPLGVGHKANSENSTHCSVDPASELEAIMAHETAMMQAGGGAGNGARGENGDVERMREKDVHRPRVKSSVMRGIMEQAGHVELSKEGDSFRAGRMATPFPPSMAGGMATPIPSPGESKSFDNVPPLPTHPDTAPATSPPSSQSVGSDDTLVPDQTAKPGRPTSIEIPKPPVFAIAQPMADSEPKANSPVKKEPPAPSVEPGMPVLVVDDDPLTRMLMKRMLTRMGCVVSTAENGQLALEMIIGESPAGKDSRYAIVFLDNQMPVMSGLEAVRKLREGFREDFVVGVTGNALLLDQEEYLAAGADHVLTKPVLEKSLKSMLVLAAQHRRRADESPDHS